MSAYDPKRTIFRLMHVNTCVSLKRYFAEKLSSYAGAKRPMVLIRIIVIISATTFMLWSPNVPAQETLAVGACMADAKSLCSGIAGTGLEPLRGCFRDHVKEVSGACLLSLASSLRSTPRAGRTSTNSARTSKSERGA